MEIQTIFLCKTITSADAFNNYDAKFAGLHSFFPIDGKYPFNIDLPFYMLLRREHRGHEDEFSLHFNLIDRDGKSIGEPTNFHVKGVFPEGHMFISVVGKIHFVFASEGDYRLDIIADQEANPFLFQYSIEIISKDARGRQTVVI